jgi:predicted O-linked N-acetylglucosamine transferase (SPINDLY family)
MTAHESREHFFNLGVEAEGAGLWQKAVGFYNQAMAISPDWPEAIYNAALVYYRLEAYGEARRHLERLVALRPDWQAAWLNLGATLAAMKAFDAALDCWRRVLKLAPQDAQALYNCGTALQAQGRISAAITFYRQVLLYHPQHAQSYTNLAICLMEEKDAASAADHFRRGLLLRPNHAESWYGLGHADIALRRFAEGADCFRKVIELQPHNSAAHYNLSVTLERLNHIDEAIHHCRTALELTPKFGEARSFHFELAQYACDWVLAEDLSVALDNLTSAQIQGGGKPSESAMVSLRRHADPKQNLAVAQAHSRFIVSQIEHREPFAYPREGTAGDRLRIGFISADFKDHAVAHHFLGLLDAMDRNVFELFGYACNPEDESRYRRWIADSFEHFTSIDLLSDRDAAQLICNDGIDILIEMMGHTRGSRLAVLALRPAPVIVSYLGFLGTTGADFIDYIIADRVVVPKRESQFYSEKIIYFPDCYQVNDNRLPHSRGDFERRMFGLPEKALVYCCFNQTYKIDRSLFEAWLAILRNVPDAILWMLNTNPIARGNLSNRAAAAGVDPNRLIFSDPLRIDMHIARLPLADIALDPFIYNGGATTANALWAGIPLVTLRGRHFVSRMSASALMAVRLPQLIAKTPIDYIRIAVNLAKDSEMRESIRRYLQDHRFDFPLFDTRRFAHYFESALRIIDQRRRQGLSPINIDL